MMRWISGALVLLLCLAAFSRPGAATEERPDTHRRRLRKRINLSIELDRATRLINDRRYEEAIPILEAVSLAYPQVDGAAELLANCYLKSGRPRDAVNLLEMRLRAKPRQFSFARYLGAAYLDLGERDKAIAAWEGVLSDEEKYSSLFGAVAKLEQEAGLYEEALSTYRRGRRFEKHRVRYTNEIIRLLRLLGRHDEAFREGLVFIDYLKKPKIEQTRFLFGIFREAGTPLSYVAAVDSAAAAEGNRTSFYTLLKALLLVEAGGYDEAKALLTGEDIFEANDFYSFLHALSGMKRRAEDPVFRDFNDDMIDLFLDVHGEVPLAPVVILMAARNRWEDAGTRDSTIAREVLALVDEAMRHRFSAAYAERAALLRAIVQLDGLRSPGEALLTLNQMRWRGKKERREVERIRIRALLASGDWHMAQENMDRLLIQPDSSLVALGRHGLGMLAFYKGDYGESIEILSGLAEKHPESEWANDALETSMMMKAALEEGEGALDLYRAAVMAVGRGEYEAAIDSLTSLEARHPYSVLGPRVLFLRAELEEALGFTDRAVAEFSRLAEAYPLHELAPRALERAGLLLAERQPAEAERRFEQIISRYPDDPFLERVRMRYMEARKAAEESTIQ